MPPWSSSLLVVLAAMILLGVQGEEDAALVRALGSDSSVERERAAGALEKRGARAQDALRKAAEAGDPEIALRARDILTRIRIALWRTPVVVRSDTLVPFGRADRFCVSADGKLAAGCDLTQVLLWSVPDGRLLRKWPVHPLGILRVELNPEGTRLISWTTDEAFLWEVPSGKLIRSYPSRSHRPRILKVSPDGTSLAVASWHAVRWIDGATGKVLWSWKPEGGACADLDISPDGRRIAVVCFNNRTLSILNSTDGSVLRKHEAQSTGSASTIDFSADGDAIVVTNPDHRVSWRLNAGDGRVEKTGILEDRYALQGRKGRFRVTRPDYPKPEDATVTRMLLTGPAYDSPDRAVLTRDDRFVAAMTLNGKEVQLFETETGKKLRDVGANLKSYAAGSDALLGGTRDGSVVHYDLDGRELKRIVGGAQPIEFVAFAGQGRALSMDQDSKVRCFELETGKEMWTETYFRFGWGPYRFHPDPLQLVGNQEEDNNYSRRQVVRFEAATGRVIQRYGRFDGYIAGIAVSPDGALVAASGRDGPLAVWESESGKQLWENRPGKNARLLLFTPDSASLVAGDDDGALVRLESRSGKKETTYSLPEKSQIHEGAITPDGRQLMVLSRVGPRLFDLKSGELRRSFEGSWSGGVAFLPGGKQAIYGMPGALVDVDTGETVRKFTTKPVTRAHPDSSRTRLGALTADGRFLLVELSTGRILREIAVPESTVDFVLGAEGAPVVFIGESREYLGSHPPRPDAGGGKNLLVLGADAEKGRLFVHAPQGMEIRDLVTLTAVRDLDLPGVTRIQAPPGSSAAYGTLQDRILRLNRETLAPLEELPPGIPRGDLDEAGGLLLAGHEVWEAMHGKSRADLGKDFVGPGAGIFFGPRGETVIGVGADGVITTLKPGP